MQKLIKQYSQKLKNIELDKYLITAILIFVPLYPKFPSIRILGTYVSVRLEDFIILFAVLMMAIPFLENIKTFIKNNVSRSLLIFLFIGTASLISGVFLTETVVLKLGALHLIRRFEYISLFFVGFLYMKQNKNSGMFEYVIKLLLLVNLFIFIYGLGQRYLNFPVIVTQNEEYSKGIALRWVPGAHINSTFAGHYDLASYLVLVMPMFVTTFFVVKDKASKIILGLSILSGFWLFSSAVSRISIVSFLVASSISLFLIKKYKEIAVLVLVSALAFGFSPDLRARYGRIIEVVKEKISSVVSVYAADGEVFEDRSTSIRLVVEWPRAIRALEKNPIFGTGYSSITLATDNDYLRSLGETGLLGFAAFILVFIYKFKSFLKFDGLKDLDINKAFVASFIGSTIGILITAVFIDVFEASKFATIYWLISGMVIAFLETDKQKNTYE